ncbi:photosynthetic complex putative assembly protein PuhB [uncultured Thiodictyon sp.]|uniref:photosynthetic complex putative assembly protein PuhB n=1 Tax=uncultured Thiodictyon sp. TaxID=1846217 RepID=UPI0025EDD99F|nr:photosynthetic complex putative assembly protein PuhB [uncultured Thiodictyon sp.]
MTEYAYEPVPGLPEQLPPGESVLWQGAPRWQSLARYAFHTRAVALYFLALVLLNFMWKLTDGEPLRAAVAGAVWLTILATITIALLVLLAWAMSRSTLYTMTNRRLVLRFGVAFPMAINLPFARITDAGLRRYADGSGDIPLTMEGPVRAGYIVLWPHAQPWNYWPPRPMLRAVPDAAEVARIFAGALLAARTDLAQSVAAQGPADAPPAIVSTDPATVILPIAGTTLH